MQPVRYYVATTLDGFIADLDGGFDFFVHDDALIADFFASLKEDYGAVVMGRATYEVGLAQGVADPYPWLRTYVVSTTLESVESPVTLLRTVDEVARLKEEETAPIWLCGGGALASALHEAELLDELELKVNPVVAGDGIPLFRGLRAPLRVTPIGDPKRYPSGIVTRRYSL